VESEVVNKSTVTVEVPKKDRDVFGSKYVEWREYRFKTRTMPNRFIVTLAAVLDENYVYFGASVCSPYDVFEEKSAYPRALGRARQAAFLIKANDCGNTATLLQEHEGEVGGVFYLSADELGNVLKTRLRTMAEKMYPIAARNAEQRSIEVETIAIEQEHGGRFSILVLKNEK
jgi:hypothetical protein